MIPSSVTAWTALVYDRYLAEMVEFLRDEPYGVRFDDLVEKTVNEILYSGTFRHLAAGDIRSEPARLWTTDADSDPARAGAGAARSRGAAAGPRPRNGERARALVQCRARAWRLALGRTRRSTDALGDDDGTAALAREVTPGMVVRARVRTAPAQPIGTWTSWAVALAGRRLGGARRAGRLGGDRRLTRTPCRRSTTAESSQAG